MKAADRWESVTTKRRALSAGWLSLFHPRRQTPMFWACSSLVLVSSGLVLIIALVLHAWFNVPFRALVQDAADYAGVEPFAGVVSIATIALWAVAATASGLGAWTLASRQKVRRPLRFLIVGTAFSLLLAADDLLQLHEGILPWLGLPEPTILTFYAVFGMIYVITFLDVIMANNGLLLFLSMAFMAASIGLDLLLPYGDVQTLFEDLFKFAGVALWACFFIAMAASVTSRRGI